MLKKITNFQTAFLLVLLFVSGCATQSPTKRQELVPQASFFDKETTDLVEIDHKYFKIYYDPEVRLAKYTIYRLRAEDLKKPTFKRKDRFKVDPILKTKKLPYVEPKEYVKSGFDRGHLVPSADFAWSEEANDLTFVMSNMAPQKPKLNQDSWRRLEHQVRHWACGEGEVTVLTGPLLGKHQDNRLKSGLIIPEQFFKIVVDETPPRKVLAFIYEQDDKGDVMKKRLTSVAAIQASSRVNLSQLINVKETELRKPATEVNWKEANCQN